MYCSNCVSEIKENQPYCLKCGCKNKHYKNPNIGDIKESTNTNNKEDTTLGLVLGILSIVLGLTTTLPGLILGIVGVSISKNKTNRILNIIGIVLGSLSLITFILAILLPILTLNYGNGQFVS